MCMRGCFSVTSSPAIDQEPQELLYSFLTCTAAEAQRVFIQTANNPPKGEK